MASSDLQMPTRTNLFGTGRLYAQHRSMSDNVILLGAGASADAGIPMMATFVERMWEMARRGAYKGHPLKDTDRNILLDALKIRDELDAFHGRAEFDPWNIEDVLSILAFDALDQRKSTERLNVMTKAIAKVIEITCQVKHNGTLTAMDPSLNEAGLYCNFWRALIDWTEKKKCGLPTVLTFNYDLVLERSLLHALIGAYYPSQPFSSSYLKVRYFTPAFEDLCFAITNATFTSRNRGEIEHSTGKVLKMVDAEGNGKSLNVDILKLHGSVNFLKASAGNEREPDSASRLISAVDDPLILPPVFNKATDLLGKGIWGKGLEALRNCKNLIICGYSMPPTDVYMQYFFKAGLGPNSDLNRIFVFDPNLFKGVGSELKDRYARNFAESIRRRIIFEPAGIDPARGGTMTHLTYLLMKGPDYLLFG